VSPPSNRPTHLAARQVDALLSYLGGITRRQRGQVGRQAAAGQRSSVGGGVRGGVEEHVVAQGGVLNPGVLSAVRVAHQGTHIWLYTWLYKIQETWIHRHTDEQQGYRQHTQPVGSGGVRKAATGASRQAPAGPDKMTRAAAAGINDDCNSRCQQGLQQLLTWAV
jgi:hypothetical protein